MVRILTGFPILWILIPGYLISLTLTFFVPQLFTGIAFDAGGVASGPMTTTFLLPFAMGACEAFGGNISDGCFRHCSAGCHDAASYHSAFRSCGQYPETHPEAEAYAGAEGSGGQYSLL